MGSAVLLVVTHAVARARRLAGLGVRKPVVVLALVLVDQVVQKPVVLHVLRLVAQLAHLHAGIMRVQVLVVRAVQDRRVEVMRVLRLAAQDVLELVLQAVLQIVAQHVQGHAQLTAAQTVLPLVIMPV